MKKKLNIIAVLLLVMVTLVTFGCKKPADLGDKVSKWNTSQSIGGNSGNLMWIVADEYDIDWWAITDMNGIVYEDYEVTIKDTSKENPQKTVTKYGEIKKGTTVELKFNLERNTKLVLYIAQDERVPAKSKNEDGTALEAGTRDYRGYVSCGPNQGYVADDGSYGQEVSPVGIVNVTCNETANGNKKEGCEEGNWTGNYRITEIWPLSNKNGPQWEATEGLKFILDNPIEEGKSLKVIYPAGESVFAIKQPDRFAENPAEGSNEAIAKEKQKDWYWCCSFYENISDDLIDDTADSNLTVKNYGAIAAHKETDAKSYDCGAYFNLKNETLYKSVLGATYLIDNSEIVYAADEK